MDKPFSEKNDRLLGKILIKAGFLSEEEHSDARTIQSRLEDQDASISIVDLLFRTGTLSAANLEKLEEYTDKHVEHLGSIMPARLRHPFLVNDDLAEEALSEGVISVSEYKRAEEIQQALQEHNLEKSIPEILVDRQAVKVPMLKALEATGEGGEKEETSDTTLSASESDSDSGSLSMGSRTGGDQLISSLDMNILEELVSRGRIKRSQIATIVQKAKERKNRSKDSDSPLRAVLKEMDLMSPEESSEIISAAMDRERRAQSNEFDLSPVQKSLIVAGLIVLLGGSAFFLVFTGENENKSKASESSSTSVNATEDESKPEQKSERSTQKEATPASEQEEEKEEKEPGPEKTYLLKFKEDFGNTFPKIDESMACRCRLFYDEELLQRRDVILKKLPFQVSFLRSVERESYAPGVYLLRCSFQQLVFSFPDQVLYSLETYAPESQSLQSYLNGETWDFVALSLLGELSDVYRTRNKVIEKLKKQVSTMQNRWKAIRTELSGDSPSREKVLDQFKLLWQFRKESKPYARDMQTFPYPEYRNRVRRALDRLPRSVAAVIIKTFEKKDIEVPSGLGKLVDTTSNLDHYEENLSQMMEELSKLSRQLPDKRKKVDLYFGMQDIFERELRTLLQAETLLVLLTRDDVQKETFQGRDTLDRAIDYNQLFQFLSAQIYLHGKLVKFAPRLRLYEQETAQQLKNIPDLLRNHMVVVLKDIAEQFDSLDMPNRLKELSSDLDRTNEKDIRKKIREITSRVDMTYPYSTSNQQD